ncbi:MAG: hypothetical protein KAG66_19420, partial [Methylococcales bacterium]|nr:hypothetical protein [Methylococcales bacterium]
FLSEKSGDTNLTGQENTPFAGLAISLNGADSAANQTSPDQVQPHPNTLTQPIFRYPDGEIGGLLAGHCEPFRMVQLGFGLEGVSGAANRAALMERSLDALLAPRVEVDMRWLPSGIDDFVLPGQSFVYTVTLQNLSERLTDTLNISIPANEWQATILTPTLTLGPCNAGQTVITVDVPLDVADDVTYFTRVTAVSHNNPQVQQTLPIKHKTPGQILLVDDDRFYNREQDYKNGLDSLNLSYDVWETGWNQTGQGSPPLEFLQAYEFILWFTGYDWFQPITTNEAEDLHTYLSDGGRLFLSSQDMLYYHENSPLVNDFFGLLSYQETVTPTQVYLPPAQGLPLNFPPYQNFSDGLIARPDSQPWMWNNRGTLSGVANQVTLDNGKLGKVVFWSLPLETLPQAAHAPALEAVLGQLGDLGGSTFEVDRRVGEIGTPRTFTITLQNDLYAPDNNVIVTIS